MTQKPKPTIPQMKEAVNKYFNDPTAQFKVEAAALALEILMSLLSAKRHDQGALLESSRHIERLHKDYSNMELETFPPHEPYIMALTSCLSVALGDLVLRVSGFEKDPVQ